MMRISGVLGALWSVIVIVGIAATYAMGSEAKADHSYSPDASAYKEASRHEAIAKEYPLAPVLARSELSRAERSDRKLRKALKSYKKIKKKRGAKRASIASAREKVDQLAYRSQDDWRDVRSSTEKRSVGVAAAMILALFGSIIVIIGAGRLGGVLMMLAALVPAAFAPLALCASSAMFVLGLAALVLGARKVSKAKKAAAEARAAAPNASPRSQRGPTEPAPAPAAGKPLGIPPTQLVPRTIAEKHDYIAFLECTKCGAGGLSVGRGGLFEDGGQWFTKDTATCSKCGTAHELKFLLPDDPLPPGGPGVRFPGDRPSSLLDAGQFLELSDVYSRRVPARLDGLNPTDRQRAITAMKAAIVYLEEALKFIPPGGTEVQRTDLFSKESRAILAKLPGQFQKARLEARMGAYRKMLGDMDPSSELCAPPSAEAPSSSAPPAAAADRFDIVLESIGPKKINCIKLVRELTGLGLKDTKDLVERAPETIARGVSREEAERIARDFSEIGSTVRSVSS